MYYKYLIVIVLLLLSNMTLEAQHTISGKVIDEQKNEMPFVNVLLFQHGDSLMLKGVVTDDQGDFKFMDIPSGNYRLEFGFLGFKSLDIMETINTSKELGAITLEEEAASLEAVTVTAQRQLIQRKIDRLVFDVEHSSKASAGDAFEVLRVTPGIRVQNDQIGIIGKSNLSLMIDDKLIKLSGEDLANFLKSISSEDIKSIEVITTPPAKYEAMGNSGLINIQLKQAKANAWNAMVRAGYWQRAFANSFAGANFNYNKNKFSLASSIFLRDNIYYQEQDDYAYFPDGLWYTRSPFKANIKGANARVDLNYKLTDSWTMGMQYLFNRTEWTISDDPYLPVFDYETNEISRVLQSEGNIDLGPTINAINYNNQIVLDTNGRQLTLNLDYFSYTNPDTKTYTGNSIIKTPYSEQFYSGINTNRQEVNNISATLDFNFPTNWAKINFGGKLSQSKSQNDISFFNSGFVDLAIPLTEAVLDNNDFEYTENIQALYFSGSKVLTDKWSTQFGLRMEATQTQSISNNLDFATENNYVKVFPSFYLSYTPNKKSSLVFSYSKRINRPQFFELNPNIYFVNPFQTIEGNAFLQPAFIDNFELAHTYGNLSSKIYLSYEENLFTQVSLADINTNIIQFTNKNYINTKRIGVSENFFFNKWKWWSSNNSINISYAVSEFSLPEEQDIQKGINSRISTNNDFVLNKNKTLHFGINYWYNFAGVDGIFDTKPISSLSLSFQYFMLNKKLKWSIRGTDLFKQEGTKQSATINNVYQEARYYYDSRSVMLSLSYQFGNNNIRAKRHQTGNQEERRRTGN